MKLPYQSFRFLILSLFISLIVLPSCNNDNNNDDDDINACDTCVIAYKPNIYLYPTANTFLSVTLDFPQGGQVIESIPAYNDVWNVNVEPSGKIDNTYDYLFYESKQPYVWQEQEGWCIEQSQLEGFFVDNLTSYGFKDREIDDFIEYWIPRLNSSDYYNIYPQNADIINQVIQLNISSTPDNILRLFYVVKESDSEITISAPEIPAFEREGFFVTEWGVIL